MRETNPMCRTDLQVSFIEHIEFASCFASGISSTEILKTASSQKTFVTERMNLHGLFCKQIQEPQLREDCAQTFAEPPSGIIDSRWVMASELRYKGISKMILETNETQRKYWNLTLGSFLPSPVYSQKVLLY